MFKNSSIKTKIILIVAVAILLSSILIALLSIYSIKEASVERIDKYKIEAYQNLRTNLENFSSVAMSIVKYHYKLSDKEKIKDVVKDYIDEQSDYLFTILQGQYNQYKSKLDEEELKALLINTIKSTRYGKSGYFWINDFNYKMVMHPIKEALTGKIFLDTPKVPFVQLGVDALKKSGEDKGYIQYSFYSPSAKRYMHKASVVKVFKPFNWIIGTGAYIDNVSKEMKEKSINAIKEMRYGKNGYFWINNMQHRMIMHPIKPELDGKVFVDAPKVPFVELGVRKLRESKKERDFIEYKFYTPSTGEYSHKLSLVSHFKPWNWVIGTGAYTDYIEENIDSLKSETKEQIETIIKEIILLTIVVFSFLILFASYLTNRAIVEPLKNFRSSLDSFFQYLADPSKKVKPIEIKSSDEFGEMSLDINKNIEMSIDTHREHSNIIQTINESVILTQSDEKGIITDVSKAFCDLSGFKREELIGQPHYVVRHPDMPREFFASMWKALQEKKSWRGKIKNVKKDGGFYWVDTTITPKLTKDGKIYGYIAIRCDVTDSQTPQKDRIKITKQINITKKRKK